MAMLIRILPALSMPSRRDHWMLTPVVVVVHADRGCGLSICRQLSRRGVIAAMHSVGPSRGITDTLEDVTNSGGRAVAIESDLDRPEDCAALITGLERLVGPVAAVVLTLHPSRPASTQRHQPDWPEELLQAREAIHWARALSRRVSTDRHAALVGLLPDRGTGGRISSLTVRTWEGTLSGLRAELAPRGVTVRLITVGERRSRCAIPVDRVAQAVGTLVIPTADAASTNDQGSCATGHDTRFPAGAGHDGGNPGTAPRTSRGGMAPWK